MASRSCRGSSCGPNRTASFHSGWTAKYGYGLEIETAGGARAWSHGGARAGYGSFVAMLPDRQAAVIVLCNRTGESLEKTRTKIVAMLGEPPPETHETAGTAIPPAEFSHYAGSYRNGSSTVRIEPRDGKLFFESKELRKGEGGWLVTKTAEGKTDDEIVSVTGADGKVESLFYMDGRSMARIR